MKFVAFLLFLFTGIAVFWQCSDMISTLRSSGAGPAIMVALWLPTIGLLVSGVLAFANLRVSAIAGGICLLLIGGFYALTLVSIQQFSFAHDWSYLVPVSGIVGSLIFVIRQFIKPKAYA